MSEQKEKKDKVEVEHTRLSKAITKAFEYFPFGFEKLQYWKGWAVGPVFLARAPEADFGLALLAADETVYKQNDSFSTKVEELLTAGRAEGDEKKAVDISKAGHPMERNKTAAIGGGFNETGPSKCTGRAMSVDDKYIGELPWALYDLGRALKVAEYRTRIHADYSLDVIFGYDKDGGLLCALAPKILSDLCRPE